MRDTDGAEVHDSNIILNEDSIAMLKRRSGTINQIDVDRDERGRVACRVRLNVYRRDAFARIIATNFPGAEEGVKAKRDVRPVHHIQIL